MTDLEALDLAVFRTGHARFRELLNPAHPDFDPRYWAVVRELAAQPVAGPEPPGLIRRAASFAGAVVQHVAAGRPMLDASGTAVRLAVCAACEQFSASRGCRLCGCNMDVKATWAEQHCPLRKWPGD